jgi:hypothetical protein
MSFFVYDGGNKLNMGGVTKTKTGIVVKSAHSQEIKKCCLEWKEVTFVDRVELLGDNPVEIVLKSTRKRYRDSETINKLLEQYPGSVVYVPGAERVVGDDISLCLNVCLFHGLANIIIPKGV